MKSFTLSIVLGILAIMCHAAPSPVQPEARQPIALSLTFFGAGGAFYEVYVTLESQEKIQSFTITNPLSVSHIFLDGPGSCTIAGVDGSETTVGEFNETDVGPPQTQVSGFCSVS